MSLLVILICLALQKLANIVVTVDAEAAKFYLGWMKPWFHKFKISKFGSWFGLVALLLPPLVVVALLRLVLAHLFFGLFYLLFLTAMLFLVLDARDLKVLLMQYFKLLESGDRDQAAASATTVLGCKCSAEVGVLERAVTVQILERSYNKILAPVFWFVVFSVYGVVGYFLITQIERLAAKISDDYKPVGQVAGVAREVLDWLPLRLSALTFALAGHFSAGFQYCYKKIFTFSADVREISTNTALLALDVKLESPEKSNAQENNMALAMVDRVLIIWLVALALFVLGSFF